LREARSFCDVVPKVLRELNAIGSAKEIIRSNRQFKFEKTKNELGLAIYEYLESMRVVFTQSPIDPANLERFLEDETVKFMDDTKVPIHRLYKMLDKHTSSNKSKKAEKKRMAGDRCFNNMEWTNRPLVKPKEVREALKKVNTAITIIHNLPVASVVGKFLKSIDGEIERTHTTRLDVSNESLSKVHRVLNADVEEGLNQFKLEQQMEEEQSSRIRRIRELLQFNHKRC
jgi:hypothetical protein